MSGDDERPAKRPRLDSLLQSPRGRKVSSAPGRMGRAAGLAVSSGGLLGSLTDRTSVALGSLAHGYNGNGTAAAWLTDPAAECLALVRYGFDLAAAMAAGVAAGLVEVSAATGRASEQLLTGQPAAGGRSCSRGARDGPFAHQRARARGRVPGKQQIDSRPVCNIVSADCFLIVSADFAICFSSNQAADGCLPPTIADAHAGPPVQAQGPREGAPGGWQQLRGRALRDSMRKRVTWEDRRAYSSLARCQPGAGAGILTTSRNAH